MPVNMGSWLAIGVAMGAATGARKRRRGDDD